MRPLRLLCALLFLGLFAPVHAQECVNPHTMIVAARLHSSLTAAGLPQTEAWSSANPVRFCADWQGSNVDPERETEVRVLWTPATLFLQFRARYRDLYTYPNQNQRQAKLWERDVAEAFLQPPGQTGHNYAEFEISPNGDWLDLAINGGRAVDMSCGMKSRVAIDEAQKLWTAELAIPMTCLTPNFDPNLRWRVNFFRVEGAEPKRFYSSWRATNTPQPNFHVPEVFAELIFQR